MLAIVWLYSPSLFRVADGINLNIKNVDLSELIVRTRRVAAFALLGILLIPIGMPGAVAYQQDGWLTQDVVGGERLSLGDEFGCHGLPGEDVYEDYDVVEDCKNYLTKRIHASKWGSEPLSFGLPEGEVDSTLSDVLISEGFRVIGDLELDVTSDSALQVISRSGGSLEQNVASKEEIEAGILENGYVNLYWEARIADLNMRRDKDVLQWIEEQPFWFTTWGEFYSAQHHAEEYSVDSNEIVLRGTNSSGDGWDVPGTTSLNVSGAEITSIKRVDNSSFSMISESTKHLQDGYRLTSPSHAYLTIPNGVEVRITLDGDFDSVLLSAANFNGLTPFMAVGHHTNDLFEWSEPFRDSPIRFTWLIEPKPDIEPNFILLGIAIVVVLAAPAAVWLALKKDREIQQRQLEEEE